MSRGHKPPSEPRLTGETSGWVKRLFGLGSSIVYKAGQVLLSLPVHLNLLVEMPICAVWHRHGNSVARKRWPSTTGLIVEPVTIVRFTLFRRFKAAYPVLGMKSPPSHPPMLGILCVRSTHGLIRLAPAGIGRPISLITMSREMTMPAPAESPMRTMDVGAMGT